MPEKFPLFRGTLRERIIVALIALPLVVVCSWCFRMMQPALGDTRLATPGSRLVLDIFHFLGTELFGAAIVFLILVFIWALFRPEWIVRMMTAAGRHVWRAVCIVFLTLLVVAFIGGMI